MSKTAYNWLGDIVIAFDRLDPGDDSARQAIAGLLGLGWSVRVGRHSRSDSQRATPDAQTPTLDDHKPDAELSDVAPLETEAPDIPDLPPEILRLTPIQDDGPSKAPVWSLGQPFPRSRKTGATRAHSGKTLFRPTVARGVVELALQTAIADGPVRIAGLVDALARRQALERIPREPRGSLIYGVQLLVDIGESMDPFARDQEELAYVIRSLVGQDGVQELAFRDDPSGAVGEGPVPTWRGYLPPPPGTTVVLISDLGIRRARGEPRGADPDRWLDFAQRVRFAECPLVAFVPYPPRYWPPKLRPLIDMVCWDRPTTVTMVRRWVRRRPGPKP